MSSLYIKLECELKFALQLAAQVVDSRADPSVDMSFKVPKTVNGQNLFRVCCLLISTIPKVRVWNGVISFKADRMYTLVKNLDKHPEARKIYLEHSLKETIPQDMRRSSSVHFRTKPNPLSRYNSFA